ncbi:transmembrane 6 superfamily member 2 isoform X2 [Calypte anna]|uniref:transmembrane 6 superfamily member 2 isoform X2 n=1 Tax=Calypte anna TaxID=9244 RepID=UPI0011C43465|nr:transmembrane 6 superfamily member 2 isoform X2 [Calypte anna]
MQLPGVQLPGVLVPSLLAIPVALGTNAATTLAESPLVLVLTGLLLLLGLISIIFITGGSHCQDPLFCVFVLLSFTSVVDLVISLEEDGFISGFVEFYIREGEPHLRTAHGIMICYWDGIVHYGLYLTMIVAIGQRKSYRNLGLFWLGSLVMSITVFLLGNLIGKYSSELSPALLLNLPYILIPLWAGGRLFQQPKTPPSFSPEKVVLDCPADSCFEYIYQREPYLRDPVAYPKVQMLIYLFYILPFFCLGIYGLVLPGCSWLPDWSLVVAGAVAQAQFSHLGSSLHPRTPFPYQTPEDVWWSFLITNLLYALGPQLLAYRCLHCPAFFLPSPPATLLPSKKHQ